MEDAGNIRTKRLLFFPAVIKIGFVSHMEDAGNWQHPNQKPKGFFSSLLSSKSGSYLISVTIST
jgi:hypothetical protein